MDVHGTDRDGCNVQGKPHGHGRQSRPKKCLFFFESSEDRMRKAQRIQAQREPQEDHMHARHYSTWVGAVPGCDNPLAAIPKCKTGKGVATKRHKRPKKKFL